MNVWVVDFNDAYHNIRCILCDDGSMVSFRNFVLIFLTETGGWKKPKCVTLISINVSCEITNKMQPCNRIYYSTVH
jgi:hypothetical protein